MAAAVQNHSPVTVHITGVHIKLKRGESVFFRDSAVTRDLNGHRTLAPGAAFSFFFDVASFQDDKLDPNDCDYVYVRDAVDREYRTEPGQVARVFKQLNTKT
jgi:hypothetical protein